MSLPISATKRKVAKEELRKYNETITVVAVGEAGSGAEEMGGKGDEEEGGTGQRAAIIGDSGGPVNAGCKEIIMNNRGTRGKEARLSHWEFALDDG